MTEFISIKPKRIQAVQWTGDNADECKAFARPSWDEKASRFWISKEGGASLWVAANSAWLDLEVGEWIAKDSLGFYPIKDSMFRETYREATDDDH